MLVRAQFSSGDSLGYECTTKLTEVVDKIHFLVAVWLKAWHLADYHAILFLEVTHIFWPWGTSTEVLSLNIASSKTEWERHWVSQDEILQNVELIFAKFCWLEAVHRFNPTKGDYFTWMWTPREKDYWVPLKMCLLHTMIITIPHPQIKIWITPTFYDFSFLEKKIWVISLNFQIF